MINNFKQLMSAVFYDWGHTYGAHPEINQSSDGSFWINKTYIYEKDGEYLLEYKTSREFISKEIFEKFKSFYQNYKGDKEFEKLLTLLSDSWYPEEKREFIFTKKDNIYNLNNKLFITQGNFNRFFLDYQNEKKEISQDLFNKFCNFYLLFK